MSSAARPVRGSAASRVVRGVDLCLCGRGDLLAAEDTPRVLRYGRAMRTRGPASARRRCGATRPRRTRRSRRAPRRRRARLPLRDLRARCGSDPAFDEPAKPAIVARACSAVTLPLALRRRFPLAVARRDRRLRRRPPGRLPTSRAAGWEGTITVLGVLAGALQRRRARPRDAAHGARRSPCSPRCVLGEVVREVFFYERRRLRRTAAQPGLPARLQRRRPRPAVVLGAAVRSLRERERELATRRPSCSASGRRTPGRRCSRSGCASRASCTTSSPTTSA